MKEIIFKLMDGEEFIQCGVFPVIGIRIEARKAGGKPEISLLLSARKQGRGMMALTLYRPYTAMLDAAPGMANAALYMPVIEGAAQAVCGAGKTGRQLLRSFMPDARILSVPETALASLAGVLGEGDWLIQIE